MRQFVVESNVRAACAAIDPELRHSMSKAAIITAMMREGLLHQGAARMTAMAHLHDSIEHIGNALGVGLRTQRLPGRASGETIDLIKKHFSRIAKQTHPTKEGRLSPEDAQTLLLALDAPDTPVNPQIAEFARNCVMGARREHNGREVNRIPTHSGEAKLSSPVARAGLGAAMAVFATTATEALLSMHGIRSVPSGDEAKRAPPHTIPTLFHMAEVSLRPKHVTGTEAKVPKFVPRLFDQAAAKPNTAAARLLARCGGDKDKAHAEAQRIVAPLLIGTDHEPKGLDMNESSGISEMCHEHFDAAKKMLNDGIDLSIVGSRTGVGAGNPAFGGLVGRRDRAWARMSRMDAS